MKHFYLILCCLASLSGLAQSSILNQTITVHITDQSLEEVLQEISETGEFYFSYNPALLDLDRVMTVHLNSVSTRKALDHVINDPSIQYKEIGSHVILNRVRIQTEPERISLPPSEVARTLPSPPKEKRIIGYIFDAESGRKLAHASIYEIYQGKAAVTNEKGAFRLRTSPHRRRISLSVKHRLYIAQNIEMQMRRQDTSIKVYLQPRTVKKVAPQSFFLASADTINPLADVAMVSWFVADSTLVNSVSEDSLDTHLGQFSIIPTLGTHKFFGRKFNRFSFNLFAGYTTGLKGVEVGGILNIDRHGVAGIQAAGVGNAVGGNLAGVQIAGIFNVNKKSVYGAQIAGFNNWADSLHGVQLSPVNNVLKGRLYGAQVTGMLNVAAGELYGAQLSGFANVCVGAVKGWQIAGFANWGKELDGVQIAGLANVSMGNSEGRVNGLQLGGLFNIGQTLTGGQVAGLFNISTGDFQGTQISSLFNIAKKGKGIQIGLVNVSDSLQGIPIGLVNIIRNGHNGLELNASMAFPLSLRLKTGNHRLYNIFSAGMKPTSQTLVWGYGYGLGTAIKVFKKSYIHGELMAWQIHQDRQLITDLNLLSQFQLAYAYPLTKRLQVSVGPTFNLHISNYRDPDTGAYLSELATNESMASWNFSNVQAQAWIGGQVGLMLLKKSK
ncbi:MAG: hypothetical protein AAF587_35545 [Bacteroidota bacterium]